jgi:hypothetical protein
LTYKDVRPWAKSIKEKVINREMPPWHADPHYGEWANDRRLSPQQIQAITAWVDQGAKEGNPKDLPPTPQFTDGWSIGKPDLVISMNEEFTLDAHGPDEYQYFDIPTNFTEDKYVMMAEARPSNRKIVHHMKFSNFDSSEYVSPLLDISATKYICSYETELGCERVQEFWFQD